MLQVLCYKFAKFCIDLKWAILGGYYLRLAMQARYLYRSSQLFKDRWQQIGLDYAEQSFEEDFGYIGRHFFWKAQNSPWPIKKQIIFDWLLNRPEQPYAISDQ